MPRDLETNKQTEPLDLEAAESLSDCPINFASKTTKPSPDPNHGMQPVLSDLLVYAQADHKASSDLIHRYYDQKTGQWDTQAFIRDRGNLSSVSAGHNPRVLHKQRTASLQKAIDDDRRKQEEKAKNRQQHIALKNIRRKIGTGSVHKSPKQPMMSQSTDNTSTTIDSTMTFTMTPGMATILNFRQGLSPVFRKL
ncbi:hypothetical protein BDN70DRAFT_604315 [Pholiota conissans]|uniref:Uncharacterized protein n=1 Tax=Pholiota conissans TaxID=109636 RepID=A0A9P6CSJ2_9AGAR|nr:hypothetical protein BDN70DRAFT_604315 [Pholiota conissans]